MLRRSIGQRRAAAAGKAVRETIERTIEDLRRTGATTFEELFAAVVKVIEDLKRKTLPRDDAKVRRKPRSK